VNEAKKSSFSLKTWTDRAIYKRSTRETMAEIMIDFPQAILDLDEHIGNN
jgi:hypothetical protein